MRILVSALFFALLLCAAFPASAAKNAHSDLCDLLKDNPIYAGEVGYSDLASNISVLADNPSGIGSTSLDSGGKSQLLARVPAILEAVVLENGVEKAFPPAGSTSSYPHGIRSVASDGDLQYEWFASFIAGDLVACSLSITNKGSSAVTLVPKLRGDLAGDAAATLRVDFDAARNMIIVGRKETGPDGKPRFTYLGLLPGFLPHECRVGDSAGGLQKTWSATGSKVAYDMIGGPFTVPPGETRRLWAVMSFAEDRNAMIDAAESKTAWMKSTVGLEKSSRDRVLKTLGKMPGPVGNPAARTLYYRSACALMRNVGASGGLFAKNRPCFAVRNRSVVTPRDASIIAVGLAEIDIKLAQEQILILTGNMNANGSMPESISKDSASAGVSVEPPLAAWAAWQVYLHKFDADFLKAVYDPLCRNTDWWFAEHDRDFDNLCEISGAADPVAPDQVYDSAELSGFMVAQLDSLAKIAAVLGRDLQAQSWKAKALAVRQRIASTLYDPTANLLFDAMVTKHEQRKTLAPSCFVPLWAGLQLPKSAEKAMARDYLGNPKYFFGTLPFPDFPYTDERYAADCRITPLTAYLMIGALRAGGRDIGDARNRFIRMLAGSGGSCEAFDARTGIGLGARENAVTAALALRTVLGRSDRMDITQPLGNNK